MPPKEKVSGKEQVDVWIEAMEPAWKETVNLLRQIILETDGLIAEQVKWNAPAFYYSGDMQAFDAREYKRDIVVMNLRQKDHVLLIFPTGATIPGHTGLLEGDYADGRRTAKIYGVEDAQAKKEVLQSALKAWLGRVE